MQQIDLNNEIVIYQSEDGKTQLDVKLEGETVWLNTKQMAVLFDKEESNIRRHITNVLKKENSTGRITCIFCTLMELRSLYPITRLTL